MNRVSMALGLLFLTGCYQTGWVGKAESDEPAEAIRFAPGACRPQIRQAPYNCRLKLLGGLTLRTTHYSPFDFDSLDRALDNYRGPRDSLGRIPLDTIFAGLKRQ